METKEQLQTKIETLESQINNLTHSLNREKKVLEDINKPVLSRKIYDLISDAVKNALYDVSFSEQDFDYELSMEYDNRVEISHMSFNEHDSLIDDVIRHIDNMFKVEEEEDEVELVESKLDYES
tara:strand:+ start:300 stop:671 length:372 start_codon:yes stop_codon:yes gene_type:complete